MQHRFVDEIVRIRIRRGAVERAIVHLPADVAGRVGSAIAGSAALTISVVDMASDFRIRGSGRFAGRDMLDLSN